MQEHTTLYYREGASDKVYQASLEPRDGGFVVRFAHGRRGSALTAGSKTPQPLDYPRAKALYDRLVRAKTAKGYTPGASGAPFTHSAQAGRDTGWRPQLLNAIDAGEADALLRDPDWALQEKFDGVRLLIRRRDDGSVEGINRKGLIVPLPAAIRQAAEAGRGAWVMDGECVGDTCQVFDLLEARGTDLRCLPYHARLFHLSTLLTTRDPALCQAFTATTTAAKTALLRQLQAAGREGVVFKRLDAPSLPGRPAIGGDALKWKFYETASFLVSRINEQRSVGLSLLENGVWSPAGNVSIPPRQEVPAVGDIVEVRYLYAYPDGGAIYHPVFLGRRRDLAPSDCTRSQLKFKAALAA